MGPWEAVWIQHKQPWGREDLPWDLHPEWFENTRLKESWGGGGVFFRDQFALENSVFTPAFQPTYPVHTVPRHHLQRTLHRQGSGFGDRERLMSVSKCFLIKAS